MNEKRRERDPKPMRDLMRTLVAGRGWHERLAVGRLREGWEEVVGAQIAARSEPVRLLRGTLTILAEAGPWATELSLLAPRVAARATEFLGGEPAVREVKVVASVRVPATPEGGR